MNGSLKQPSIQLSNLPSLTCGEILKRDLFSHIFLVSKHNTDLTSVSSKDLVIWLDEYEAILDFTKVILPYVSIPPYPWQIYV